ncbi:hypothetical protein JMJ77_0001819, partial [Colletotrichum scovillei]
SGSALNVNYEYSVRCRELDEISELCLCQVRSVPNVSVSVLVVA